MMCVSKSINFIGIVVFNWFLSYILLFECDDLIFLFLFCLGSQQYTWSSGDVLTPWKIFPLVVSSVLLISSEFAKWDSSILVLAGWDAAISTGWEGLATIPSEAESIWDVKSCWPVVTLWTLFKMQDYKSLLSFLEPTRQQQQQQKDFLISCKLVFANINLRGWHWHLFLFFIFNFLMNFPSGTPLSRQTLIYVSLPKF